MTMPMSVVRDILEAPCYSDIVHDERRRTKDALIAGDLLCMLYLMGQFGLSPSLNRALYAFSAYAANATYRDGTRIPTSEPKLRSCWRQFGPVAPLWAAVQVNRVYPYAPDQAVFEAGHFEKLLSVAAGLRAFAVALVPKGTRPPVPILDPVATWEMPDGTRPANLHSVRFPDKLAAFLENYAAPRNNAY